MRVIIEDCKPEEEETIIIRCKEVDASLMKLINRFKQGKIHITLTKDGNIFRMEPKDIYYFESVDNRTFAYDKDKVYETKLKLYELEKEYGESDFVRVSKSSIVNLSKIKSLSPAFSGRLEATLKNGEKLIISRQYVSLLREKLGI